MYDSVVTGAIEVMLDEFRNVRTVFDDEHPRHGVILLKTPGRIVHRSPGFRLLQVEFQPDVVSATGCISPDARIPSRSWCGSPDGHRRAGRRWFCRSPA